MKKSITKIIAVILSLFVIGTVFAACSKDDGTVEVDNSERVKANEIEASAKEELKDVKVSAKDIETELAVIIDNLGKMDSKKVAEKVIASATKLEAMSILREGKESNQIYQLSMKMKVYAKNAYDSLIPIDSGAMAVLKNEIDPLAKDISENMEKSIEDFMTLLGAE